MSATIIPIGPVRRNRHPVDELADVRTEIKTLQAKEAELRDLIIAEGCDLEGEEFEANVSRVESLKLDTKAVRKEFGDERLRAFLKPSEVLTVRVKAIDRSHLAEMEI